MKRSFAAVLLLASVLTAFPCMSEEIKSTGTIASYFSPNGGAAEAIVKEINSAKTEVLVQAYSFTSKPIAEALAGAHKRGVKVVIVLDKSQRSGHTSVDFVAQAGIPTYIDASHLILHNKTMVLDRSTLITGSFNFTRAAEERNAENLLIIKGNKPLIDRYLQNFDEHKAHSDAYTGKAEAPKGAAPQ